MSLELRQSARLLCPNKSNDPAIDRAHQRPGHRTGEQGRSTNAMLPRDKRGTRGGVGPLGGGGGGGAGGDGKHCKSQTAPSVP